MNTIVVWLLISISAGPYNEGTVTCVGRFVNQNDCEFVRQEVLKMGNVRTSCIRAKILPDLGGGQ